MKGITKPEIWLLLAKGLRPIDIIRLGYPKRTVYNYSAKFPFVRIAYRNALRRIRINLENENHK